MQTPGDSPPRGQDVLPMGATLDAAHAHGVSAGRGQGLSRAPLPVEARGGGERRPLEDLPPAREHGGAGQPGVPASQKAIVPTCMQTARLTANRRHRRGRGRPSGTGFVSGRRCSRVPLPCRELPPRRTPKTTTQKESPLRHRQRGRERLRLRLQEKGGRGSYRQNDQVTGDSPFRLLTARNKN